MRGSGPEDSGRVSTGSSAAASMLASAQRIRDSTSTGLVLLCVLLVGCLVSHYRGASQASNFTRRLVEGCAWAQKGGELATQRYVAAHRSTQAERFPRRGAARAPAANNLSCVSSNWPRSAALLSTVLYSVP